MGKIFRSLSLAAVLAVTVCAQVSAQPGYPSSYRAYAGERDNRGTSADVTPPALEDVGFQQRLNEMLPLFLAIAVVHAA